MFTTSPSSFHLVYSGTQKAEPATSAVFVQFENDGVPSVFSGAAAVGRRLRHQGCPADEGGHQGRWKAKTIGTFGEKGG